MWYRYILRQWPPLFILFLYNSILVLGRVECGRTGGNGHNHFEGRVMPPSVGAMRRSRIKSASVRKIKLWTRWKTPMNAEYIILKINLQWQIVWTTLVIPSTFPTTCSPFNTSSKLHRTHCNNTICNCHAIIAANYVLRLAFRNRGRVDVC